MELWDLFNREGAFVATDHVRGSEMPKGSYHKIVRTVVQHTDGEYLLMQRDENKAGNPGKFEFTAGGSATKGEDFEAAAMRELYEETGVSANELHQLTDMIVRSNGPFLEMIFFCVTDISKEAIMLQEGETQAYKWVSREEILVHQDNPSYLIRLTPDLWTQMDAIYASYC